MKTTFKNIDEYISLQDIVVKEKLQILRKAILDVVPKAEEVISYGMPAFKINGSVIVYFAAYKNHIGFYPTGTGIEAFKDELSNYKWSKGAVQFALDKALPLSLIKKMVKFKCKESEEKLKLKTIKKK